MIFFRGPAVRSIAGVSCALLLGAVSCRAEPTPPRPPAPAERIEVGPLGYIPPNAFYLTYRLSSMSMGFFDNDHLLFTFRMGGLLRRLPGDRAGDDDQQIRAVVLDLHSGQVVKQAEWRMHDRSRYLWTYPDGKFLVRIRDSLYLTDQSLQLMPYLTFDNPLRLVETSPDRQITVLETDVSGGEPRPSLGDRPAASDDHVQVDLLRSGTHSAFAVSRSNSVVALPLVRDGLVGFLEGSKVGTWALREAQFQGKPTIVAEVKSSCEPTLQPVSESVVLVMGCYPEGEGDRPVYAISTGGKLLWQQRWETKYVWGDFDYAEDGSRFAYESIATNRPISAFDSLDPQDVTAQMTGVYDTETGKLVLVKNATPILSAGQNAALSPDGSRFAILRNDAIEIYNLPPVEAPSAPSAVAKKK